MTLQPGKEVNVRREVDWVECDELSLGLTDDGKQGIIAVIADDRHFGVQADPTVLRDIAASLGEIADEVEANLAAADE